MVYKAAIFDMDGTILDTSQDLTHSLNHIMKQAGHRHDYTVSDIHNFFGSGVQVAIKRALAYEYGASVESLVAVGTDQEVLPSKVTDDEVERLLGLFKPYYEKHSNIKTGPFAGILQMSKQLHQKGLKLAVVSNKPNEAVQILVQQHFDGYFDFVLGQADQIRRKPYPDMVNKCVEELNVKPEDCVYIGDSEIDLQTAANAKMDEIAVTWGFRNSEFLKKFGATILVNNAQELENEILK
ncbi:HAD family hydrolase [Lactobacillus hominis]|uniref:Putative phosphoglycolate phosphatase n=1 Tax=Lactobacillus hominis DSM 23910 = CRBIP 24.179 TaxID=1423758 RepID=I7L5Z2_9LACO|nr:HAD family hydrolase [Lactobacillus hominis]KRM84455.1 phosphatase [Lactobacillus hominis DSM 23910 = CRBIP 24.179]MCT3347936.1 HAD family hydrolase [Lactobacillus hominis]CCI81707.1 Putative phosphoglycolate phosphatase [Lactobacillus hominis DSM 23910 = CRBIP 24.179]